MPLGLLFLILWAFLSGPLALQLTSAGKAFYPLWGHIHCLHSHHILSKKPGHVCSFPSFSFCSTTKTCFKRCSKSSTDSTVHPFYFWFAGCFVALWSLAWALNLAITWLWPRICCWPSTKCGRRLMLQIHTKSTCSWLPQIWWLIHWYGGGDVVCVCVCGWHMLACCMWMACVLDIQHTAFLCLDIKCRSFLYFSFCKVCL